GPFRSVEEFHGQLIARACSEWPEDQSDLIWHKIRQVHPRPHRMVLTYNDLGPHNILVDNNLHITRIVDWEVAGCLPEYWCFTKATYLPVYCIPQGNWLALMLQVFPQYSDEREAERYLWKYRLRYI
ncbi:hypothetical protein HETIRDRAFT_310875, partial [Heterobasidion irregulare TC 32-1]